MSFALHDTHFHLDLFDDPEKIIAQIETEKIYTIAVTNVPEVFAHTQHLVEGSKFIRPALGLHPELVYQYKNQLPLFIDLLQHTRYVGEVGLDNFKKSKDDFSEQKKVFEKIVTACDDAGNKVLTIHSRRAEKEVISIVGESFSGKVILHWYSGPLKEIDRALENGFYFSINYAMTQSDNGKKIIERIPTDRLLLESDGPFAKVNGKDSTPTAVKLTMEKLIDLKLSEHNGYLTPSLIYGNLRNLLS